MVDLASILLLGAIPVVGLAAGFFAVKLASITRKRLNISLHVASGIVLGVVAVEIMPEAMAPDVRVASLVAFVAGGLALLGIDAATHHVAQMRNQHGKGALALIAGITLDLALDGVMLGAAFGVTPRLAWLLAASLALASAPIAFAAFASLRLAPRGTARTAWISLGIFAAASVAGAVAGGVLLEAASHVARIAVIAFNAGALTMLVVEQMIPEAHEATEQDPRGAASAFLAGFALLGAMSLFL